MPYMRKDFTETLTEKILREQREMREKIAAVEVPLLATESENERVPNKLVAKPPGLSDEESEKESEKERVPKEKNRNQSARK